MRMKHSSSAPDIACPICKTVTKSYFVAKILPELCASPLHELDQAAWLADTLQRIEDFENGVILL